MYENGHLTPTPLLEGEGKALFSEYLEARSIREARLK